MSGSTPSESDAVELRLHLEPGEPLRGELRGEGDPSTTSFDGWIDLIAAINAARAGDSGDSPQP